MSDLSIDGRRHHRAPRLEFNVYFAAIFVAAIPFATLAWLRDAIDPGREAGKGPLCRARSVARTITPMIFSA
jgi:hypothetical protein